MRTKILNQLRQTTLTLSFIGALGFFAISSAPVFALPSTTESLTSGNIQSNNNSAAQANLMNAVTAVMATATGNTVSANGSGSASANTNPTNGGANVATTNNNKLNFVSNFTSQLDKASQAVTDTASNLVTTAFSFLGVPYKFGGTNADTGIDCSALVMLIYKESLGMVLPRTAAEQAKASQSIDEKDLKPGDLVFYNTMKRTFSHVGIYVGDGKFIHAPRAGALVRVEEMNQAYWKKRFDGARRVVSQTPTLQAR